jgi:hypothetical protein
LSHIFTKVKTWKADPSQYTLVACEEGLGGGWREEEHRGREGESDGTVSADEATDGAQVIGKGPG